MRDFDKGLYERYEALCKTRLSKNFILRDFMFSTEAAVAGHSNFPSDSVEQVIRGGKALCERVLEPILARFGRFSIWFGYQARETMERTWSEEKRCTDKHSSSPHHWDRGGRFDGFPYVRVDILPYCVEDGEVSKEEFARWCLLNLDIDLFMMWRRANIFCITISPQPRRIWLEWVPMGEGENGSNKIEHMGRRYWQDEYPKLPDELRPRFHPSATDGRMSWSR